jgi:hypothetical protein
MRSSGTRRGWRTARQRRRGRWAHELAWVGGAVLVGVGAMLGAFGTVAWLTVLCASSAPQVLLGVLSLGVAPVLGGGALLWAGRSALESHAARSRARSIPDARLVEAVQGGASSATVALRLGVGDTLEVELRLDELVASDALTLVVTEEGEVLYRAPASV